MRSICSDAMKTKLQMNSEMQYGRIALTPKWLTQLRSASFQMCRLFSTVLIIIVIAITYLQNILETSVQARHGLCDECPCWFSNKRLHVLTWAVHIVNVYFEHWMWALKEHNRTFQCIYAHMYTVPFKWPQWHFNKFIWVFVKANTDVCLSVHQFS